ncbi:MAG: lysophospholipid acyltransferase family protein [Deltaproteobacteria bacterium]|nr:lysophospholipid acyltransferase family protein [Deltaproteobacteria bacterium]
MSLLIDPEIAARVRTLELPFGADGIDPFGVSQRDLAWSYTLLGRLYRHYFRVQTQGIEHVPDRGRAMLVGNHSGGVAVDGLMVIASMFFEKNPPRLAHGMIEKFIADQPFAGMWASRTGQLVGLPEHATRLLESERLLMVFPEGARGTAKLFPKRNSLVEFGTGFVRLALQTNTPIVPFGFVGGGAAIPTVYNAYKLGKLLGVPYVPVTPYLLPLPLPVSLRVHYGEPLRFEGTGREDDDVIQGYVDTVKDRIAALIQDGRGAA